jgi:hypothetical protein
VLQWTTSSALPYGLPPQQVDPTFTSPLAPPPPASWPPWMSSWNQQSLAHSFHIMTMVPPAATDWVTDFGASNHTTSSADNLTSVQPPLSTDHSSIIVGNGSSLPITSVGNTAFSVRFILIMPLLHPTLLKKLSIHRFTTDNWCSMQFDPYDLSVKDLSSQNVIARCDNPGSLYTMCLPSRSTPSPCVASAAALAASTSTWHRCLGHPSVYTLSKLSSDSSVICSRRAHDFCQACQLGHHTRMPFTSSTSRADNIFDLIHCDMWTSLVVSISGYKYYLLIIDDHSYFMSTFPLRVKYDTFFILSIFFCLCLHIVCLHHQSCSVRQRP